MRRGDLALVRPGELPVQNGRLAAHVDALGAVRAGEDECRHEVVGAAELEPVQAPDGEVGALAGLEEPRSRRPRTSAPPRVQAESASRTVSA